MANNPTKASSMAAAPVLSYTPAPHILSRSPLTATQLASHFQDFYTSLEYISCAPTLVFDRLVANLNETFIGVLEVERLQHIATLEQERIKHSTTLAKCLDENKLLRLSNSQLETELAALKESITITNSQNDASDVVAVPKVSIGTFHTEEIRPWDQLRENTSKLALFSNPYSSPPGLVVGFNSLVIANSAPIRIHVFASNIRNDRFDINFATWSHATLYAGSCSWLEVGENNPDIQFGTFDTEEDCLGDNPRSLHTRLITFTQSYSTPPRVIVWFTKLKMSHKFDWRVKTYETNITASGFTLHIDTWGGSVLNFAIASWVAYPADRPDIFCGKFSTLDVRPAINPQNHTSSHVNFGRNGDFFAVPPRVLVAINSLEISCKNNLRLRVSTPKITATGMTWNIDTWDTLDSVIYSAGASYIAVA